MPPVLPGLQENRSESHRNGVHNIDNCKLLDNDLDSERGADLRGCSYQWDGMGITVGSLADSHNGKLKGSKERTDQHGDLVCSKFLRRIYWRVVELFLLRWSVPNICRKQTDGLRYLCRDNDLC